MPKDFQPGLGLSEISTDLEYAKQPIEVSASALRVICTIPDGRKDLCILCSKSVCANNNIMAFLYRSQPGIRLVSLQGLSKGIISEARSPIVDFSFCVDKCDILVSLEKQGIIWIHKIEERGLRLEPQNMRKIVIASGSAPWAVRCTGMLSFDAGFRHSCYLFLGIDEELHAYPWIPAQSVDEVQLSSSPRINLGDCSRIFSVSLDGSRVASCMGEIVSIFLLPSPAAHCSWSPHGECAVDALKFIEINNALVTFSQTGNSISLWNTDLIEPVCIRFISLPSKTVDIIDNSFVNFLILRDLRSSEMSLIDLHEDVKTRYKLDEFDDGVEQIVPVLQNSNPALLFRYQDHIASVALDTASYGGNTEYSSDIKSIKDAMHNNHHVEEKLSSLERTETVLDDTFRNDAPVISSHRLKHTGPLQSQMVQTTAALVKASKAFSSFRNSLEKLQAHLDTFGVEFKDGTKHVTKERVNYCAHATNNMNVELSHDTYFENHIKVLRSKLTSSVQHTAREVGKSLEREVSKHLIEPLDDFEGKLRLELTGSIHGIMTSVNVEPCLQKLAALHNDLLSGSSEKETIVALNAMKRHNEAIELALETRSPEIVLWTLMEACPLTVWAELVVDEALEPLIVLSLIYNICVSLSAHACDFPAKTSGDLLIFVRDAIVTYRARWVEPAHTRLYSEIATLCYNLLENVEKEEIKGPLFASLRDTVRLLRRP